MKHISQRVAQIQASPMRVLEPYAAQAVAQGKKVYHLNIGQPDIVTPPKFLEAIHAYNKPTVAYGASQGETFLLEAIQQYYKGYGMEFPLEGICVTNGGSEALNFAMLTLCDPGDEIVVFEPFYADYCNIAKRGNIKIVGVPTSPESGYHLPAKEVIEQAITAKTKAILLTNPSNPTGVVYTQEEMQLIADLVVAHDLILISDEVYREFVYDGAYHSFGCMPELDDRLIIIDSISKRYSACGARIGCLVTKNPEIFLQVSKLSQTRICTPALEQVGAAALYQTPASYFEAVNVEYKKRRDIVAAALEAMPGVLSSHPEGAFYVMVKLPVDDIDRFAIWLLTEFEVEGATVMFAPGGAFYTQSGAGTTECRLAYVLKCEDLAKAMEILKQGLEAYPHKTC